MSGDLLVWQKSHNKLLWNNMYYDGSLIARIEMKNQGNLVPTVVILVDSNINR